MLSPTRPELLTLPGGKYKYPCCEGSKEITGSLNPTEIRNAIYMAALSDWQVFMNMSAEPCGPPLSEPRPHEGFTSADLANFARTCKTIGEELGSLAGQTPPTRNLLVSFDEIEDFNLVFPSAESSFHVWIQVVEPMKANPPKARGSFDLTPFVEMLSSGATIHLPPSLELAGAYWSQWKALLSKGELQHVSLSYRASRGYKFRYIICNEAGLEWNDHGFGAMKEEFPELASLAGVDSLVQCEAWGPIEVEWPQAATSTSMKAES